MCSMVRIVSLTYLNKRDCLPKIRPLQRRSRNSLYLILRGFSERQCRRGPFHIYQSRALSVYWRGNASKFFAHTLLFSDCDDGIEMTSGYDDCSLENGSAPSSRMFK